MSSLEGIKVRVARALSRHALAVSPRERADWTQAMINEIAHLPPGASAVGWALSCVSVCYAERTRVMLRPLNSLPRWILVLEMLLCFLPLTLLFSAVAVTGSHGGFSPPVFLLYFSGTMLGPLGLLAAYALIFVKPGRWPTAVMPALCLLTVWNVVSYSALLLSSEHFHWEDSWREVVLIAVLPTVAVLHLVSIHSTVRPRLGGNLPSAENIL